MPPQGKWQIQKMELCTRRLAWDKKTKNKKNKKPTRDEKIGGGTGRKRMTGSWCDQQMNNNSAIKCLAEKTGETGFGLDSSYTGNYCSFSLLFKNIYLAVLGLSCRVRDLIPWPGIEPGPLCLGVPSLSHWTSREVPIANFLESDHGFVVLKIMYF